MTSHAAPSAGRTTWLVASGDQRSAANQAGWPAQAELEANLCRAFRQAGVELVRAHPFDAEAGHGFIDGQRMGLDILHDIPAGDPVVVAEAVWQYSQHVLGGLRSRRGPILTAANWSGQWPGLVGLLNLNASLTKAGIAYSTIWSTDFSDDFAQQAVRSWVRDGVVEHDVSHVRDYDEAVSDSSATALGRQIADELLRRPAIIGVFDEGCMGMYNAIVDDELLNRAGIYKERLSQSALVARMERTPELEARRAFEWLRDRGLRFELGEDHHTDLTEDQVIEQLKMYLAAVQIAADYCCDAIGIQYQTGLMDSVAASDLAEGLLNNADRPPVYDESTGAELFAGQPVPHFNEVDEGCAIDAVVTNRVWRALALDPALTLHDLRWGDWFEDQFVWVFLISGAVPASHLVGGYAGASSDRQPPVYFPRGGGTLKGVSKPGRIVWSRVFVMDGRLHVDLGRGSVVALPDDETKRRWAATTPQWPIMHATLHGVSRDQMMARHRSNHLTVAYAPDEVSAARALWAKAAVFAELGVDVHLCGDVGVRQ